MRGGWMKTYFEESLAISMTLRQSAVALWVELQWISAAAGRGGRLVVTEGVPMSLDTIHAMIGGPGKHMKKSMLRKDFRELESRGLVVTRHGISELPAVVEWADGLQKTSQSGVGRESDVSRTRVGPESDVSRTTRARA